MPAFKALNLNVSAETDYLPLIAAAGVFLLEADHITQLYLHNRFSPRKLIFGYGVEADKQSLICSRSDEAAFCAAWAKSFSREAYIIPLEELIIAPSPLALTP